MVYMLLNIFETDYRVIEMTVLSFLVEITMLSLQILHHFEHVLVRANYV